MCFPFKGNLLKVVPLKIKIYIDFNEMLLQKEK